MRTLFSIFLIVALITACGKKTTFPTTGGIYIINNSKLITLINLPPSFRTTAYEFCSTANFVDEKVIHNSDFIKNGTWVLVVLDEPKTLTSKKVSNHLQHETYLIDSIFIQFRYDFLANKPYARLTNGKFISFEKYRPYYSAKLGKLFLNEMELELDKLLIESP